VLPKRKYTVFKKHCDTVTLPYIKLIVEFNFTTCKTCYLIAMVHSEPICMLCLEACGGNLGVYVQHSRPVGAHCSATTLCITCVGTVYSQGQFGPPNLCMTCSAGHPGPSQHDVRKARSPATCATLLRAAGVCGSDEAVNSAAAAAMITARKTFADVTNALDSVPRLRRAWVHLMNVTRRTSALNYGKRRPIRQVTMRARRLRLSHCQSLLSTARATLKSELQSVGLMFTI